MTKRNIERSGESADAFERTSESPDRGDLNGGPVPDQLFGPTERSARRREIRVSRGTDPRRPPKGGARRLRDLGSPSERDSRQGESVASRPRGLRGQVVGFRHLLKRDDVGTPRDDSGEKDIPRLQLQQSRRNRDG